MSIMTFFLVVLIHDLRALGVIQKIQIMGSLEVDDLFKIGSWT